MKKFFLFIICCIIASVSFSQDIENENSNESRGMGNRSRTWVGLSSFDVTVESEPGQKYILCFGAGEINPGYTIDKVKFYYRDSYGSTTYDPEFNIKIYTGGNRTWIERNIHTPYTDTENTYTTNSSDMGTLQYTQSFTASGIGYQIVNLSTPFEIPSNEEVWIALECIGTACIGATKTSDTSTVWTQYLRQIPESQGFKVEVPLFRKTYSGEIIVLPYQYCISVEVNDQIDRCDFGAKFYDPTTQWVSYQTPITQQIINFEETYDTYYRIQTAVFNAGPDSARKQLTGHYIFTDADGRTQTIDTIFRTNASTPTAPGEGWVTGQYSPGYALIPMSTLRAMTFPVELSLVLDFAGVEADLSNDTARLTIIDEASFNVYDTLIVDACESYYWEGSYYYNSGEYTRTFNRAEYGDSIKMLILNIYHNETNYLYETVNGGYIWDGQRYCYSGNYINYYQTEHGCDSTVYLYLTVIPNTTELHITARGGYIWDGLRYTNSGNYIQQYQSAIGCDSTVYLYLTVTPITTELNITAYGGYVWDGLTYTSSGNYIQQYTTPEGWDSTVYLYLTIIPITTELNITACDSYEWDGLNYTSTGNYIQQYQSYEGWDSTVYLYLTVEYSVRNSFSDTACASYTWNDETYYSSGSYEQHFETTSACDSIVTLLLTILPTHDAILYDTVYTHTAYNRYGFSISPNEIATSGDYIFTRNIPLEDECDSVVKLNLCVISNVSLSDYENDHFAKLYPNPAFNIVNIVTNQQMIRDIYCYNVMGSIVATYQNIGNTNYVINVSDWNSGIYFIKVICQEGSQTLKLTINR